MRGAAILLLSALSTEPAPAAELRAETLTDWGRYVARTEARIASELDAAVDDEQAFFAHERLEPRAAARCRRTIEAGAICVVERETRDADGDGIDIRKGLVHHWLGATLVPDVTLDELLAWMQAPELHPPHFDEVEAAGTLTRDGDELATFLKLKRKKIVTARYNTEHHVVYRHHGEPRASSRSLSTRIVELDGEGEDEREKPEGDDRGFLWRLNAYWRFEQTADGVLVECESLSLSRGVPRVLRWMIAGQIEGVARESLERTLEGVRAGAAAHREES